MNLSRASAHADDEEAAAGAAEVQIITERRKEG
jgi:hypothetical protein